MGFLSNTNSKIENVLIIVGLVFGVVVIVVMSVFITAKVMTARFKKQKDKVVFGLEQENTDLINRIQSQSSVTIQHR